MRIHTALGSLRSYYFTHMHTKNIAQAYSFTGSKEAANFFGDFTLAENTGNSENHNLFYVEFILIKH